MPDVPPQKPTVIVTEGSSPAPLRWLCERAQVLEVSLDAAGFADALARAEGAIVRTYTRVDIAFLAAAPRLRVVGRGGVGLDNIDVSACRERGVEVVYTPDANTAAVADLVFAQLIRLIRPLHEIRSAADVSPDAWKQARQDAGLLLSELTLGILGMGRVGRAVGRIAARGFGMRVVYHDLQDVAAAIDFDARAVSHEELLKQATALTLHVDGRPENRNLVDEAMLADFMGRYLVNMSRGMVLCEAAVADAVRQRRLDGVAVDVFEPEPPGADSPLVALARSGANVLLTPHMASRAHSAVENMSWVVRDVMAVLEGRPPKFPAP